MLKLTTSPIAFDPKAHTYTLDGKQLSGITSTLIHRAFPDKYKGVPESTLNKAAARGSNIHEISELYDTLQVMTETPELTSYRHILRDNNLQFEAAEYIVSDNTRYASAIDRVYTTLNGTIVLADIKTTAELDLLSVALQLSIYKQMFLAQNPHLADTEILLAAIWLRNDQSRYEIVNPVPEDALAALYEAEQNDTDYNVALLYGNLPTIVANAEMEIVRIETQLKDLQEQQKLLKAGLTEAMGNCGIKTYETEHLRLSRIAPSTSTGFDLNQFKADHPELYAQYNNKVIQKQASIRITIK